MNLPSDLTNNPDWKAHANEQKHTFGVCVTILVLICIPIIIGIIIFIVAIFATMRMVRSYNTPSESYIVSSVKPGEVKKVIKSLESYVLNLGKEGYVLDLKSEGYEVAQDKNGKINIYNNGKLFMSLDRNSVKKGDLKALLNNVDINDPKQVQMAIIKYVRENDGKLKYKELANMLTIYINSLFKRNKPVENYLWKIERPNGEESVTYFNQPKSPLAPQSSDNITTQEFMYLPNMEKDFVNLQLSNDNFINAFASKDEIYKQYDSTQMPEDDVNKYSIVEKDTRLLNEILDKTMIPNEAGYTNIDGSKSYDNFNPTTVADKIVSDYTLYNKNAAVMASGLHK